MNDLDLLREAQIVLRSLLGRTRRALQEDEDPDHVPELRVVTVSTLAEDPLYGDARSLLDALDKRLRGVL